MKKIFLLLATGFGVGFLPAAGTFGSLWGILFFWGLSGLSPTPYRATLAAFFFLAVYCAAVAEQEFGHDSGKIVIDEVVGMMITLSFFPSGASPFSSFHLVLGFVLFRLFDILKPFPISFIEKKVPGGWGVVLDDVAAGIMANCVLRIISLFL